jgi:hypothetical protein
MWRRVVCWVATDVSEEHMVACHPITCWNYFFNPEDGGDMFLRNVGCNSTDYTASHPRRWYSSCTFNFTMKNTIFWDITPCSPLKSTDVTEVHIASIFGYAYHLLSRWFHAGLIFRPWRWRQCVPPKRRLTFNGLHRIIFQIFQWVVLFISTAVKTSNPT